MSSCVVSDHTILAIVEGMRKYGLIDKKPRICKDMAEALRFTNEYMTSARYSKHNSIDDYALLTNHQEVTAVPRDYVDGEILAACKCWKYQIDTGNSCLFACSENGGMEFLTIFESVEMLEKKLIAACKAEGTLKVKCYFGDYKYFFYDEEIDDFVDMFEHYGWDLYDLPKAA